MKLVSAKIIGQNVSSAVYLRQESERGHKDYVMSRGALMEFARCPARWVKGFFKEGSDATEWGSLIDILALSPEKFSELYAVAPATYMSEGTKTKPAEEKPWNWNATVCKEWRESQGDKTVLKASEHEEAKAANVRLHEDGVISEIIRQSDKQVFALAEFKADNGIVVPVKCLIDLMPKNGAYTGALADLKTTRDGSEREFARAIFTANYDAQAALYLDCFNAATGEQREEWLFLIQENFAPWQTARRILSQEFLDIGRAKYLRALRLYADCLNENFFPDYDDLSRNNFKGWTITEPEAWMISRTIDGATPFHEPAQLPSADEKEDVFH